MQMDLDGADDLIQENKFLNANVSEYDALIKASYKWLSLPGLFSIQPLKTIFNVPLNGP